MKKPFLLFLSFFSVTACFAADDVEGPYHGLSQTVIVGESTTASGTINEVVAFIANQLANNRNIQNISDSRIAVGSFVNITDLNETDKLGMYVAESLMHEMHVRGFNIIDFKTRENLRVKQEGDFVFSRDLSEIKRSHNIHYYLSGTITRNADGAIINARIVKADTNLIASTAQGFIPNKSLEKINAFKNKTSEKIIIRSVTPTVQPNPVSVK